MSQKYETFRRRLSSTLQWRKQATPIAEILAVVPSVGALGGPRGTVVLVRADLDVPLKDGRVDDLSRLESELATLKYCRDQDWVTLVMGHIGREPSTSLAPVAIALGELLKQEVPLISDWLDGDVISFELRDVVNGAKPGSVFMCENTRKYEVERSLWDAQNVDNLPLIERLFSTAQSIAEIVAIHINESIAASNPDFSSMVLPLAIESSGMGFFLASELRDHVEIATRSDIVIFSGLKANKLDDLEAMVRRPNVKLVIAAGALAGGLLKATNPLNSLGAAETDPTYVGFIAPERQEQSQRIVNYCRERSIQLALPLDYVLDTGEIVVGSIPDGKAQLDVGPSTSEFFETTIRDYVADRTQNGLASIAFYNGVFGKFEDTRFAAGTERFVHFLRELTADGVKTYVGGGEGRKALLQYGSENDVTHAFTAGGTILKILGGRGIPYLEALKAAQGTDK